MVVDTQRRKRLSAKRLALASAGLLAVAATVTFLVTIAFADAPMVTSGSIKVSFGPATTVNTTMVRTITVRGTWAFPTHNSDCNADTDGSSPDIAGAGYAVAWNDPHQQGNLVTALPSGSVNVGVKQGNAYNNPDDEVHPTPADPGTGTIFSDPLYTTVPPKSADGWKSGCGTYDPVAGYNSGSWGPLSHTYTEADLEQGVSICAVLYNVAASGTGAAGAPGGSVPIDATEVTAGGPVHNDNNSVEAMGAQDICTPIVLPGLVNQALGPVQIPTQITDTVTVHGAASAPPATAITFNVYAASDTACSSPLNPTPLPATGSSGVYTSAGYKPSAVGSYVWVPTYTDPATSVPYAGACGAPNATSVVTKTAPSLSLQPSPGATVAIGTSVSAQATLTGATAGAGGTVTYGLYADSACTSLVASLTPSPNTVSGSTVPGSKSRTVTAAGTSYLQAAYTGDAKNGAATSACTQFVVTPATPSVSTQLSATGPVAIGTSVSEQATLTGATGDAAGTIVYKLYSDSSCSAALADLTPSPATVSAGAAPASTTYTFTRAGTYYLGATYSGDANNTGPVASPCASGRIVVVPNTPSVSVGLSLSSPAAIGAPVTAQATLTGATADAGGSIAYGVYSDSGCTSLLAGLTPSPATVSAGAAPASAAFTLPHAGAYYFQATYAGDGNNTGPVSSACARLDVARNTVTVAVTVSPSSTAAIGAPVSVQATLQGATAGAGGSISYGLYADAACTSLLTALTPGVNGVSGGAAPGSKTATLAHAGTYYFQAAYSGDGDDTSASSTCTAGKLVIARNAPTVSLQLSTGGPVAIGATVSAQASLQGATAGVGGSVSYALYADSACTLPVANLTPGSNTVSGASAPASTGQTFAHAGTFYFGVTYSGDPDNSGPVASACAAGRIVVSPNSTALALQPSWSGHVAIGTSISARSTLTGATAGAGGSIAYTLYSGTACTTAVADLTPSPSTVTAGAVPNSKSFSVTSAGTFYLVATYSGDTDDAGVSSSCAAGLLVVDPNAPSVTTQLSQTGPVAIGTSVSEQAALHGATANAGGSVTYGLYANDTCTVLVAGLTPSPSTVSAGAVPASNAVTLMAAGTYYLQAVYGGDPNNIGPVASTCTSGRLVVSPNTPSVAVQLTPGGPAAIGAAITAQATLSAATTDAGGTIGYRAYSDNTCTTLVADVTPASNAVAAGAVPASLGATFAAAGTYYFQAAYSGDGNNTGPVSSPCTKLVVSPNAPTLTVQLSAGGPVAIGTGVSEQGILHGATAGAGGTVTYGVYADASCTTRIADLTPAANTVTGGSLPASTAYPFPNAGTYYLQATYSGDGDNTGPVSSTCTSGSIVVSRNAPPLSIQLSAASPAAIGSSVTAQATLHGATASAGGTISYGLYSDPACTTAVDDLTPSPATVTAASVPPSKAHAFAHAGTWYFRAVYSGDANNATASSACTSGQLTASPGTPSVAVQLSAAGAAVPIGTTLNVQSTLSGAAASAGGSVTYTLYRDSACSVVVADLTPSPNTVAGGAMPSSKAYVLASAGTFYVRASYSGDADDNPASSPCAAGVVTVSRNAPALTVQLSLAGPVAAGTAVSEQASLQGATGNASGTIGYGVYSDSGCTALVAALTPGANAVASGGIPASLAYTAAAAGTLYFQASYSGDASNSAASSACSSGQLTVTGSGGGSGGGGSSGGSHGGGGGGGLIASVAITLGPKSQSIASGGTANFTITVTNDGQYTLQNVNVSDPQAPACSRGPGSLAALGYMQPAAVVTYSCSLGGVGSSFTNTASLTALADNSQTLDVSDSAPVTVSALTPPPATTAGSTGSRPSSGTGTSSTSTGTKKKPVVHHPRIAITMTPKSQTRRLRMAKARTTASAKLVLRRPTAVFRITVRNTGDVALASVRVSDAHARGCAKRLGTLAPGKTVAYTCRRAKLTRSFKNLAHAYGVAPASKNVLVGSSAAVTVVVKRPN